jgi:hypothetical protein
MPIFAPFLAALGSTVTANAIAGASLLGTTISAIAGSSGRNRAIGIEFSNLFRQNVNMEYIGHYLESGVEHIPAQPTVESGKREACTFTKVSDTACGTVGVIVYKISAHSVDNRQIQTLYLCVMWSVPFDYNLYSNWLAVGTKDTINSSEINRDLWYDMYYNNETWFQRLRADAGRPCDITSGGVRTVATMSNIGTCVLKVEVKPTDEVLRLYAEQEKNRK